MCDRSLVTTPPSRSRSARPVAIDLFSGAGGMSLGFEQAGFDVVAAVEYDPVHAATHSFNFPQAEVLCRDISNVQASEVLAAAQRGFKRLRPRTPWPGTVDAVIGGPPCQGFSTGGIRDASDERNNLLLEFVRLVEALKPKTFCLENVAGLLESKFDSVRNEALSRLQSAGYAISGSEGTLNSLHYGVPQTRRRVIVLGSLGNVAPVRPSQVDGEVSVREALEGLAAPGGYSELLISDVVRLRPDDQDRRLSIVSKYARGLAGLERIRGDKSSPRQWDSQFMTGGRRTLHTDQTVARFSETERGKVEPKSRLYRLPLDGPSRTLRAGSGPERGSHTSPRPIHPTEDRVITVREAARIHGYPDWFRFHTTNWHGHRQVGNSVPPPLARAAAGALLKSLNQSPVAPRVAVPLGDVELLSLPRTKAQIAVEGLWSDLPAARVEQSVIVVPALAGGGF